MAHLHYSVPARPPAPMRLLQVIASMDPSHGGPPECAAQICRALKRRGGTADIVTLDSPTARWGIDGSLVFRLGPKRLGTYSYSEKLVSWLHANAWHYDAVIVHGLWQYHGLATWRALAGTETPYFVFPHGMLDPWFKQRYPLKHLKKQLYWPWAEYRVLRDAAAVLFMCEEEQRLARESFNRYRVNEVVVGGGIAAPTGDPSAQREAFLERFPGLRDKRVVLFLGRLHSKKGCDELIQAFARVAPKHPTLHLAMVGPGSSEYVASLTQQAREARIDSRITWTGLLRDELKWGAFHTAEAFILPSHQENFGISVAEALACARPVLVSNKVNIWREIEAFVAGLIDNDTVEGTTALLERWMRFEPVDRERMGRHALTCFNSKFHIDATTEQLLQTIRAKLCEPQQMSAA